MTTKNGLQHASQWNILIFVREKLPPYGGFLLYLLYYRLFVVVDHYRLCLSCSCSSSFVFCYSKTTINPSALTSFKIWVIYKGRCPQWGLRRGRGHPDEDKSEVVMTSVGFCILIWLIFFAVQPVLEFINLFIYTIVNLHILNTSRPTVTS